MPRGAAADGRSRRGPWRALRAHRCLDGRECRSVVRMSTAPLLDVKDLEQRYTLPRESLFRPHGQVRALNGVSVQVQAGKSLGIVGASGWGKSTYARVVM